MRKHIVAEYQVGVAVLFDNPGRIAAAMKRHIGSDTLVARHLGDIRCRLDPQHAHAGRDEMLQQVAVVAGDFDDQVIFRQFETLAHRLGVATRMFHPGIGVRRKIRVFAEKFRRRRELFQLHQKAGVANARMQRKKRLHGVQIGPLDMCLTQRRHSEIDERRQFGRAAEPAANRGCCRRFSGGNADHGLSRSSNRHQRSIKAISAGRHSGISPAVKCGPSAMNPTIALEGACDRGPIESPFGE